MFRMSVFAQTVYTNGYQPHDRTEIPGSLIFRSPTPEWGGRLTNIVYHQGWLMTGYEGPGSNPATNDLRFRVLDISNLQNNPAPVPFWPSDFGQTGDINNRGREHWYTGNWGYHTHGHGRTAKTVHWPPLNVDVFGGAVQTGLHPDEEFNYGWDSPSNTGGRLRRNLPWVATHDWAYSTTNFDTILLGRAMKTDPEGNTYYNNYKIRPVAQIAGGNGGVRGFPVLLGGYFYIVSDQRMSGVAVYRVPDVSPQELNSSDPIPELELVGINTERFGGYWPEVYASGDGRLFFVGTTSDNIQVMEVTDPSNPQLVRDFVPTVNGVPYPFTNASYPKFQDNLLMVDGLVVNMDRLISGHNEPVDLVLEAPASGGYDPSQYSMPLGNLVVTGGYGEHNGGLHIHVRQQARDTTRPQVAFHAPRVNQTDVSRHHPISVIIHEELDSRTLNYGTNFSIRRVVDDQPTGAPVDAIINLGSDNVLMITPVAPLAEGTTYQVDFPEQNGLTDISGNAIEPYSFRFSTGSDLILSNPAPEITQFSASTLKPTPGASVTFTLMFSDEDATDVRFDTGQGNGFGSWLPLTSDQTQQTFTQTYADTGRFTPRVQVRDSNLSISTDQLSLLVWNAPPSTRPTRSSPIVVDSLGDVWAVNPDADTVTKLDGESFEKLFEIPVGKDPRSIAEDALGRMWVTCFDSDEILLLDTNGAWLFTVPLPYGDAPYGICPSPDGQTMYVSAYGSGVLYQIPVSAPATRVPIPLGPTPRAIAVDADHSTVWVTRFISPDLHGEVWAVTPGSGSVQTVKLGYDSTPDQNNAGAGVPNYLAGIAISPLGTSLVVSGSEANVLRGEQFGTAGGTHENTVRAMVAVVDPSTRQERLTSRFDIDNSESPTGISFSPDGSMVMLSLQGNNQVVFLDAVNLLADRLTAEVPLRKTTGTESGSGGKAPQGLVIDPLTQRVFTQNLMSRSVTVFDASAALASNRFSMQRLAEVNKVEVDGLSPAVRLGKEVFYNAMDSRMGAESYASCATCHVDGGHDGRVWDFTHAGEGLRRTTDLRGRAGMAQGNVHWSANFDEIQDFELVMRDRFLGDGFLDDADVDPALGPAGVHAGRSLELDALAAYVAFLGNESVPRSPHRTESGNLTAAAIRGRDVFVNEGCATCHSGAEFTASRSVGLQSVGTQHAFSGNRLGHLLNGIDIPTLQGLHDSRTFGHMGQADTLAGFLDYVGGLWTEAEDGTPGGGADVITRRDNGTGGGGGNWDLMGFSNATGVRLRPQEFVSFSGIDGGRGGNGRLQLRVTASPWGGDSSRQLLIRVNGVDQQQLTLHRGGGIPGARASDLRFYTVDVPLLDGTSNTFELRSVSNGQDMYVDGIVVSRPEDLDAASVHRELPAQDIEDLVAFLQQLDGSHDQVTQMQAASVEQQPSSVSSQAGSYFQLEVLATGTPLPSIQWQRNMGDGWVDLDNETSSTLLFMDGGTIDEGVYRAVVQNQEGSTTTQTVTVQLAGAASNWRSSTFSSSLLDPDISGWSADPDGDGYSNRAEFVLGMNPQGDDGSSRPAIRMMPSGEETAFEFRLTSVLGDASVEVQYSENLQSWTSLPPSGMEELSTSNGVRSMRIRRPAPVDGAVYFRILTR